MPSIYELTEEQQEKYDALIESNDEVAVNAYLTIQGEKYIDDALDNFEEAYVGKYGNDEAFAQDMADNLGDIPKGSPWPHYCIDWEWAARELMMDHYEENGHYFRSV